MTTDREQLELAAKAAGLQFIEFDPTMAALGTASLVLRAGEYWSPLYDDGDEARLEAALMLDVLWFHSRVVVTNQDGTVEIMEYFSNHNGDRQAARRAAGVRVAAEIGRKM